MKKTDATESKAKPKAKPKPKLLGSVRGGVAFAMLHAATRLEGKFSWWPSFLSSSLPKIPSPWSVEQTARSVHRYLQNECMNPLLHPSSVDGWLLYNTGIRRELLRDLTGLVDKSGMQGYLQSIDLILPDRRWQPHSAPPAPDGSNETLATIVKCSAAYMFDCDASDDSDKVKVGKPPNGMPRPLKIAKLRDTGLTIAQFKSLTTFMQMWLDMDIDHGAAAVDMRFERPDSSLLARLCVGAPTWSMKLIENWHRLEPHGSAYLSPAELYFELFPDSKLNEIEAIFQDPMRPIPSDRSELDELSAAYLVAAGSKKSGREEARRAWQEPGDLFLNISVNKRTKFLADEMNDGNSEDDSEKDKEDKDDRGAKMASTAAFLCEWHWRNRMSESSMIPRCLKPPRVAGKESRDVIFQKIADARVVRLPDPCPSLSTKILKEKSSRKGRKAPEDEEEDHG